MKKLLNRVLPAHLLFLIAIWFVLVAIFMFSRYAALFYIRPDLVSSPHVLKAFWTGCRFDIQVACYALFVPFCLLFVAFLFDFQRNWFGKAIRIWCIVVVVLAFIISASDIPYFHFFNARFTTAALQWSTDFVQQLRFLVKEIAYYPFYFVGGFAIFWTIKWVERIWKKTHSLASVEWSKREKSTALVVGLVLLWLGCFGFRSPDVIDMKEADCTPEGFLNQLSLNPMLTFFDSFSRFNINFVTTKEAIRRVQESFGIQKPVGESPISRNRMGKKTDGAAKPNVVLILVESLSAEKIGKLTPRLDSLAAKNGSVKFENFFSVGIHTSNGLFGSLFSYPVMISEHPMNSRSAQACVFEGMPMTLRENGYRTSFFCTHGKEFDGIGPFFERNGFDWIVDKNFYPTAKHAGPWGIPDEILMEGAFSKLDSMSHDTTNRQPFFSTILTISTHPPYDLPKFTTFKPTTSDKIDATYEYADWALGRFFDSCATRDWYKNTIFVVCGDHGLNTRHGSTDLDLSYNHIFGLLHAPGFFQKSQVSQAVGSQLDIFPTVMGLLGLDWTNNTFGIDLLNEKRPFAYFSQDTRMGVIDAENLFVIRKSGSTSLYKWHDEMATDFENDQPELAKTMRNYGCSMLQTSNWIIDRKLTGKQ